MSVKKVDQVRRDKGFKLWDIAVYGILAALILALFCAFVFFAPAASSGSSANSISIFAGFNSDQRQVFSYDFATDTPVIYDGTRITVNENSAERLLLTFHGESEGEYNVITIDKLNRTVDVTKANCPAQNCVYSPVISSGSSLPIICTSHGMTITKDYVSGSVIQ